MRTALLRDREERREQVGHVDERAIPDHGAVRKRGDRALQVEHRFGRYGDDLGPVRSGDAAQLTDPVAVRPATPTYEHGVAEVEDITAVERSRRLDRDISFSLPASCIIPQIGIDLRINYAAIQSVTASFTRLKRRVAL